MMASSPKPKNFMPAHDIVSIMKTRQRDGHPLLQRMIEVRDKYNGPQVDYIVPFVSNKDEEDLDPMTPMLIAEAIDHVAMRASSVMPGIYVPAVDGAKQRGKGSREYASLRKGALQYVYQCSKFNLIQRRAYRHLAAYATTSLVVVPDDERQMPKIKIRDPLTSYPDIQAAEDYDEPRNAGFIFGKSATWLRHHFPACRSEYGGPVGEPKSTDEIWDCYEWIDHDHTSIGILGVRADAYQRASDVSGGEKWMELHWWENKTGMLPAVIPARVTLDRVLSQVANVVGHIDLMAKMMMLNVIAAERAVFPDTYIIGDANRTPTITGGRWKDGREGDINIVSEARAIGRLTQTPDPAGLQMLDRLERNMRISTGLVPQAGGESYGALRTGRGIDSLMGAAVDPRVQELQEIMEAWLPHLNRVILQTMKTHWGSKTYSMYTGKVGSFREFEFTPSKHVETLENTVRYSVPGADVVETNVVLQQMLGSGAISRRTFRERHPWVDDAEQEQNLVNEEQLESVMLQSIQQGLMEGRFPPVFGAYVEAEVRKGFDIFEAVERADRRLQERQAEPVTPDEQGMLPPEAMPGVAAGPGAAMAPVAPAPEEMPPSIGPTSDQEGLRELMNAIAATNRVSM